MKNYLSMGFGVNSVALYLLMQDLDMEFEAVFINHGGDYPETYAYADYFIASGRPVTVLKPSAGGCDNLYDYCINHGVMPLRMRRWCTDKFKIRVIQQYCISPNYQHIGIDAGESHRAKLGSLKGSENRFLLIENGIDREGCINIIKEKWLKVPIKSWCYFCPFQRKSQWRKLRHSQNGLWCKALKIETNVNERRLLKGKKPFYLASGDSPLPAHIHDKQMVLPGMEELEYPPCQCGL
jgi:hypothetical protein